MDGMSFRRIFDIILSFGSRRAIKIALVLALAGCGISYLSIQYAIRKKRRFQSANRVELFRLRKSGSSNFAQWTDWNREGLNTPVSMTPIRSRSPIPADDRSTADHVLDLADHASHLVDELKRLETSGHMEQLSLESSLWNNTRVLHLELERLKVTLDDVRLLLADGSISHLSADSGVNTPSNLEYQQSSLSMDNDPDASKEPSPDEEYFSADDDLPSSSWNDGDREDVGGSGSADCRSLQVWLLSHESRRQLSDEQRSSFWGQLNKFGKYACYAEGLNFHARHGVKVRTIRDKLVGCENEVDFFTKTYAIRKAFNIALMDKDCLDRLISNGKNIMRLLLNQAKKDFLSFSSCLDDMISYCSDPDNLVQIQEELFMRNCTELSFYDIVLDFLLMDSLDDLEDPSSTLLNVIRNPWLSPGLRERALGSICWAIIQAKRKMIKYQSGFLSRYYDICSHITPALVWGFLGTDETLRNTCMLFKEEFIGFMRDIYSVEKARYDRWESLAEDVIALADHHLNNMGILPA